MSQRERIEAEIRGLKYALEESDYAVIKTLEGIADCTSATGIIAFLKEITDEIRETIANRKAWRAKINELEAELENLTENTVEG